MPQIYVNDAYKEDGIGDAVFHDPDKTNIQAYRDGLRLVREAAGRDVGLGLGDDPADVFRARGVELSPGPQFGPQGIGHVRLNLATSPAVLEATVRAMGG